jgi:2-iminobutanoate/2-iminopropanoate deaminase
MQKETIATKNAPAAVGPYSQAIAIGELVYTAGQIALDKDTGKLVEGGIEAQAEQALTNLKAVLEAAGSRMDHVVKTTVFLRDMGDYATVNEIYSRFFGANAPARSAVAVAGLPLDALVEIEAVAVRQAG